jgi:hypothetical protein
VDRQPIQVLFRHDLSESAATIDHLAVVRRAEFDEQTACEAGHDEERCKRRAGRVRELSPHT